MNLFEMIGAAYSFYTLACAVIFPVLAALAVFCGLRRAGTVRKILVYFISMPIYSALCIFLLCEPQKSLLPLLERAGLVLSVSQPEVVGFLAALTLGVLYLGVVSLVCGARTMMRGLWVMNLVFTLIFTAFSGFLTYMAHAVVPSPVKTVSAPTLGKAFEYFGINLSADFGLDLTALLAAAVYIIICFVSLTGASRILREERTSLRRPADADYDAAIEPCCSVCQYARQLKDSAAEVLCDKVGVVAGDHSCRRFVYDPLKRRPARLPAQSENAASLPGAGTNPHE